MQNLFEAELFACCLLLVTFYSLGVNFCSLLVSFCSLLLTFCLLLVIFCSLLVTFSLLFVIFCSLLAIFCSLVVSFSSKLLSNKIHVNCKRIVSLQWKLQHRYFPCNFLRFWQVFLDSDFQSFLNM